MITFWHYSPCPPIPGPPQRQSRLNPGGGQNSLIGMADPTSMTGGIALAWIEDASKGIRRRIEFFAARRRCYSRRLRLSRSATTQVRAETLSGDRRIPKKDTWKKRYGQLLPRLCHCVSSISPLLSRGYHATRSDASKDKLEKRESACSIVCSALKRLRIHLSEKRIEGIWTKFAPHSHQIGQMSGTQI